MSNRLKLVVVGIVCVFLVVGAIFFSRSLEKNNLQNTCVDFARFVNSGDMKNSYALYSKSATNNLTQGEWSNKAAKAKGSYGTDYNIIISSKSKDNAKSGSIIGMQTKTNQTPHFYIECLIVNEGNKQKVDQFSATAL
jgi:hypothetical protein